MATFKVGQRVKYVSARCREGRLWCARKLVGLTGTIVRSNGDDPEEWEWVVELDRPMHVAYQQIPDNQMYADSCMLAPLTDPKAEEFIASLEKLGREPMPMERERLELSLSE